MPHSRPSGLLDARRIKELIEENTKNFSREERLQVLANIASSMKKLPRDQPVAIPDPTSYINKANLMTIDHDTRLEILDQLVPQKMWGTPKHIALLTDMGIDAVAISKCNAIHVPFQLHHGKGITNKTALLDTGATESFINIHTVDCLHLGKQKLENPCPVFNMDGTANKQGTITHVMIHPYFSLPPRLSPTHQQYQHPHHRQHQHQHLPSMSTTQQHQLPVTPPPLTPDIIRHNPWRTNEQSCSSQRRNKALGLFFYSWTPRPCSNPLCCTPHQQPHPLQTTSPSLCSPTTLCLPSMPLSGSPGIQIALCKEKDLRLFKSPVSACFPQTA